VKQALSVFLAVAALLIFGCANTTAKDVEVDVSNLSLQAALPPGYPVTLEGSTLAIQGYVGQPVVHSYPRFAGVENVGDIGIGNAIGYNNGNSITLPINANLGTGQLMSYKVCISIDTPQTLSLQGLTGSNQYLAQYYYDQYSRAQGFEKIPSKSDSPLCVWDTSSGQAASGRVNLAEIKFNIIQDLPPHGVNLTVELSELKDGQGNDLCPSISTSGCALKDGIIIHNFRVMPAN
jgi:hypothetical protein